MTRQLLFAVNCCACGANLGATCTAEILIAGEIYCRNCIRPLQTRVHEDELIDECLQDLSNPVMVQLNREANEILKLSPIAEEDRWWEGTSYNISLDSDDEMCENTKATGQSGEEQQQ